MSLLRCQPAPARHYLDLWNGDKEKADSARKSASKNQSMGQDHSLAQDFFFDLQESHKCAGMSMGKNKGGGKRLELSGRSTSLYPAVVSN